MNSVSDEHVTSLLPFLTASDPEQLTLTTVPGTTGNCVVVLIVPVHSAFSPVQPTDIMFVEIYSILIMTKSTA